METQTVKPSIESLIEAGREFYYLGQNGFEIKTAEYEGTVSLGVEGNDVKVYERRYDNSAGDHRDLPSFIKFSDLVVLTAIATGTHINQDEVQLVEQGVVLADRNKKVSFYEQELQRQTVALQNARSARDEVINNIVYGTPTEITGDIL